MNNYLTLSEDYKNQIDVWYRTYNITREKLELFHEFLLSLFELIEQTYMGEDIMIEEIHHKNHFDWCWNKTVENFSKERIHFKEKGNCYLYFWNFFLEAYYITKLEDKPIRISEYFYKLFDFNHIKTRSELDVVVEIYKLFDQNLKK